MLWLMAIRYRVEPTACESVRDGERVPLGSSSDGEQHYLHVVHLPGHTKGSIALHYPQMQALFTGDFLYNCGHGGSLLDWLPTSSVPDYLSSCGKMVGWLDENELVKIYGGHFDYGFSASYGVQLLEQYMDSRGCAINRLPPACCSFFTWLFFTVGCFRCCPCG